MQIELTPEQDAFVQATVANGRYQSAVDAVHHALDLWVERERVRLELLASIEEGERSLAEDGVTLLESDEDIKTFLNKIEENGKAHLDARSKPIDAPHRCA